MGGLLDRLKRSTIGRFYAKWSADRAGDGAILIAWQALLSLFPLILGLLSVLGYVLRDPEARASIVGGIASQFPSQFGDLLGFLEETRDLGGILGIVSLLGLLWSGSTLFGAMAMVFNRFYGVADRGLVGQRLTAFVMIAIYAALIPVSVLASGISTFLVGVSEQVLPFNVPGSAFVVGWLVSITSAAAMFLALYRLVPNTPLSFREIWRGALLATVLFVALSQIFPIYLGYMGGGFAVYKTLGVFFLMMTWFYFVANVIVLGAELNAFYGGHGETASKAVAKDRGAPAGAKDTPATAASRPAPAPAAKSAELVTSAPPGQRDERDGRRPTWKIVAWAGLTAALAGVTLAAAQKTAAGVWRAIMHESPPR